MTLLLLSWLLFAPAFLLLRRALLTSDTLAEGATARGARTPQELAARLHVHLSLLDGACEHAERARAEGRAASAALMLACVRQGAEGLVRDLDADVAAWGEATSGLQDAPDIGLAPRAPLQSAWLRALAWSHRVGRAALPGRVARLRLHLVLVRGMLAVIRWEATRIEAPPLRRRVWRDLSALRADAPAVVEQAQRGHTALVNSTYTVGEEWRLAT